MSILGNRRGRVMISFVATTILFVLLRLLWTPPDKPMSQFFDTSRWPDIYDRLWILDITWSWIMVHVSLTLAVKLSTMDRQPSFKLAAVISVMVSTFSSFLGTTRASWYMGVELFIAHSLAGMIVLLVCFSVLNRIANKDAPKRPAASPEPRALTSSYRSPRPTAVPPPEQLEPIHTYPHDPSSE